MDYGYLAILIAVCCMAGAQADLILPEFHKNVEIHRVFGQEHPGPYKHPASITQLANGDLYIAYYGGAYEYDEATAVFGSRRRDGEREWSQPQIIASTPFQGVGNPVVWQAPDGVVWLFYVNQGGATWSEAFAKAKISTDGAHTWSDSFVLAGEPGSMVRGQPIVLRNGDYLLPMYHETGRDRQRTDADTSSYFLRFNPATRQWTETNRIRSPQGNLQAQVVQLTDTDLFCVMRRGGGFGPTTDGWMLRSQSNDGGHTWSDAERTDLPNPNSAVELIQLRNGNLLLIFNDNMNARTPLTAAISSDGGKTWPHRRVLIGGDNDYAYPYAIEGKDGRIYLVFTTNGRTTIMMAVFEEAAILEHSE